jgi:phosphatidylserine/phosphatidylglycerophosphate/cardiolipin synthase-like enzyme
MAAFRAWLPDLLGAGATVVRHPGMAHAKIYRFDDRLLIGSCNLDDLSLYRNDELDLQLDGRAIEGLAEPVFDELVAASTPATPSSGLAGRAFEQVMRRSSRLL